MFSIAQAEQTVKPMAKIQVYFNNGYSCQTPWHVGEKVNGAIVTDLGHFRNSEEAVAVGASYARLTGLDLTVPYWLQRIADEKLVDDARYAECRENDNIGREESSAGW